MPTSDFDFEPNTSESWRVYRIDRLQDLCPGKDAKVLNPLVHLDHIHDSYFVRDGEAVIKSVVVDSLAEPTSRFCFQRAGPRMHNFFKPAEVLAQPPLPSLPCSLALVLQSSAFT
jgi:hypothetical protein